MKAKALTTDNLGGIFGRTKEYVDSVRDTIVFHRFDGVYDSLEAADEAWGEGKVFFIRNKYAFMRFDLNADGEWPCSDAGAVYNHTVTVPPMGIPGYRTGLTANAGLYILPVENGIEIHEVKDTTSQNKPDIKLVARLGDVEALPESQTPHYVLELKCSDVNSLMLTVDSGTPYSIDAPERNAYILGLMEFMKPFAVMSEEELAASWWRWSNIRFVIDGSVYSVVGYGDSFMDGGVCLRIAKGDQAYELWLMDFMHLLSGRASVMILNTSL